MLETPLKAFRTALCMAHKSDQQGDTMPKGAFDALNHISLTHLLVSQSFNMIVEHFEPNACQGGIFDEQATEEDLSSGARISSRLRPISNPLGPQCVRFWSIWGGGDGAINHTCSISLIWRPDEPFYPF